MLPVLEQNIVLYLPWKTQQRILHFKKPKFYAKGKCFQRTNLKNRPSDLIRTDTQWVTQFSCYNNCRKSKEEQRMKQKYYVELNRQEWRLIIEGLNRFRNKLIAAGRYTDAVDEILIKVAKAKPQKSMLWEWRHWWWKSTLPKALAMPRKNIRAKRGTSLESGR